MFDAVPEHITAMEQSWNRYSHRTGMVMEQVMITIMIAQRQFGTVCSVVWSVPNEGSLMDRCDFFFFFLFLGWSSPKKTETVRERVQTEDLTSRS